MLLDWNVPWKVLRLERVRRWAVAMTLSILIARHRKIQMEELSMPRIMIRNLFLQRSMERNEIRQFPL